MQKRYYAAYGSNLNIQQMKQRCPSARTIGTSTIPDYELLFKGNHRGAYLTIEARLDAEVPVGIWEVDPEAEMALDQYEDYPTLYYKKEMILPVHEFASGGIKDRPVFVYIMDESHPLAMPSREYIEICLVGYEDFNFDGSYIYIAINQYKSVK